MQESRELATTHFNVEKVPILHRKRVWADGLSEYFYDYDMSFPADFNAGTLSGVSRQGFRTATVRSDPMEVRRLAMHIAKDPMDSYFLLFPGGGPITLSQRGKEISVGKRQLAYVATTQPYTYTQRTAETFYCLILPGAMVRARNPDVEDSIVQGFHSALEGVFVDFALSFCTSSTQIESPVAERVIEQVLDLFALTVEGADHESSETAVQSSHRRRAMHAIERNFRDPNFNLRSLSQILNLSDRYLQKIFANKDDTVSQIIRRRRIDEARRLLRLRPTSHLSIAEIAYSVGFLDAAYFSRVFQQEAGVSPRRFE